ncbi:hypothetical protein GGR20_000653 [Devosia subaequoris]|uniref:Uncharacterized protein n=1 Tax=Devosia subaequoris TaxID=395930 RepID=A0A7W6IK36_9HYPH|nr:hypothetical protein [Devosia subaequoris]MBB4051035.1 hypothetical protein [Devosia subaequoris]MCP1208297.1 hypothetical protein [Devosia subaequoris]
MNEAEFDFAIFGSTPMAQLLAGLLGREHGRKVLLVGQNRAGYRLPRGLDISVAPITRPQSWTRLIGTAPETARLVVRIAGRNALSRVDPVFFAEAPRAVEALSHMRHMAGGFGIAAEPVGQSMLGGNRLGMVLRDTLRLNRAHLEAGLERWLKDCTVERPVPRSVAIENDGAAKIETDTGIHWARQAVLADDEAIVAWLPLRQWPTLFQRVRHTSILTTPTRPLAAPIMLELDKGLFLTQQTEGGVAAFGPGERAAFSEHVLNLLGQNRKVEQAGQTNYVALGTRDGAPAFGRAAGQGADVVANIGCYGAFIAPALARWLAGEPSAEEARWFEQHLVNRTSRQTRVDEFQWPLEGHVA